MKVRNLTLALGAFALSCANFAAGAANQAMPFTVSTGFYGNQWTVNNACGAGFGIDEARNTAESDAYDGGFRLSVNGTVFQVPSSIVDLTGTVVTAPVAAMSGLNTRVQYKFMTGSQVVRVLATFDNPTAGSMTVPVQMDTNFGSDGSTQVQATSSGDLIVGSADTWFVTSEGTPSSDPVMTTAWGSVGAASAPSSVTPSTFSCAGTEGISVVHSLTVPAGQSRSLMYFGGLGGITAPDNAIPSALANAPLFNSLSGMPNEWLSDLDGTTISRVVNWAAGPSTTCASEGHTGTKLTWCQNICEKGYTGATLDMWIHRWVNRYRDLPYCAQEGGGEEPPPQET